MSRYSFITMRKDIECLGVRSHQNPFLWEEDSNLHKQLMGRYPYGAPKKNHINCLTEYCWQAYQKSVTSVGAMRIGRQADVWKEEIFKQYLMDKGRTYGRGKQRVIFLLSINGLGR
ncbi:hypothetical protein NUH87_15120 [Pseudomonas batumici]|uniref:hypothetical protein n=1 Tax=Pseudomonas batumici TaxID=226910 RepID=UPI0030D13AE0